MKVVIDTNVLVSGTINPHGAPGQIVDAVLLQALTVIYDDRIISEYREVLRRPRFGFSENDVEKLVQAIEVNGTFATATGLDILLPDPSDLPFLEVAEAGEADALITGNVKHFVPLRGSHRVRIWAPAELAQHLRTS